MQCLMREGQHIGGGILAAIVAVEPAAFFLFHQAHGQLVGGVIRLAVTLQGVIGHGPCQRRGHPGLELMARRQRLAIDLALGDSELQVHDHGRCLAH